MESIVTPIATPTKYADISIGRERGSKSYSNSYIAISITDIVTKHGTKCCSVGKELLDALLRCH